MLGKYPSINAVVPEIDTKDTGKLVILVAERDWLFTTDEALLHKSFDGRTSPFPGQTHPTTSVTGMPRAVKPFKTATRTWRTPQPDGRSPAPLSDDLTVSHSASWSRRGFGGGSRSIVARSSGRSVLMRTGLRFVRSPPAVSGFHGLAFLRGGMMAAAPRAAMASWHLRVSKAPSAVTLAIS